MTAGWRALSACCQPRTATIAAMDTPLRSAIIALSLAMAVAGAAALAPPAYASKKRDNQAEARALLQQGEILPLGRILQIVQERVPGDIIEVELDLSDKHGWEYEVKVLASNGRVLEVDVNARTGVIRKIEDD